MNQDVCYRSLGEFFVMGDIMRGSFNMKGYKTSQHMTLKELNGIIPHIMFNFDLVLPSEVNRR